MEEKMPEEIVEYYSNAEECRKNALATTDEDARVHWLQLVKDWQVLAKTSGAIPVC